MTDTDPLQQILDELDPRARFAARFSAETKARFISALVEDGATNASAEEAWNASARSAATYIFLGPFRPTPARTVRREISTLSRLAESVVQYHRAMSHDAQGRLSFALQPKPIFGRLSRRPTANPDPIYLGDGAPSTGLLRMGGVVPANMAAKFDRVLRDLEELAPLIQRAAEFEAKKGRPENWGAHRLFRDAIDAWTTAALVMPTGAEVGGLATAPLLRCLREMIIAGTDDQEVRDALSDEIYLAELRRFKEQGRGGLLRLKPDHKPRKRGKAAKPRPSSAV